MPARLTVSLGHYFQVCTSMRLPRARGSEPHSRVGVSSWHGTRTVPSTVAIESDQHGYLEAIPGSGVDQKEKKESDQTTEPDNQAQPRQDKRGTTGDPLFMLQATQTRALSRERLLAVACFQKLSHALHDLPKSSCEAKLGSINIRVVVFKLKADCRLAAKFSFSASLSISCAPDQWHRK